MKILLTGKDDFSYNRSQVLLAGLNQTPGVELVYFPILKGKKFDSAEFRRLSGSCDFVYIPPFRHSDVKNIKSLSKAPVVFDALISKFLTRTIDHGKWWTAWEKSWRDRVAFRHSDCILMDTDAHREYIIRMYGLNESRVFSLPVGVDTNLFKPGRERTEGGPFKVGFYGGFIPLQGVDKIVAAANQLKNEKDIHFEVIGNGPTYTPVMKQVAKLGLTNVTFVGRVPYEELNDSINGFDLCLGIFGDSLKTDLVVPNKVYHYAALRKCIITKDTVGIREVFADQKNSVLVQNAPERISRAILELKENPALRKSIAQEAYSLITRQYNHLKIAERFLKILQSI